jgi:hypothetical protein
MPTDHLQVMHGTTPAVLSFGSDPVIGRRLLAGMLENAGACQALDVNLWPVRDQRQYDYFAGLLLPGNQIGN